MGRSPGGVQPVKARDGRIRYRVRCTIAGKRASFGIHDTEDEAWIALASVLELHAEQIGGLTLASWIVRWLDRRELDGLHRSVDDMRSIWRARISRAPFVLFPIHRITRQHLVAWVRDMLRRPPGKGHGHVAEPTGKTKRSTAANALNLLRQALHDAADEGHAPVNVAVGVRVPKVPTTESWTYLEADEIAAVAALPVAPPRKRPRGSISAAQRSAILTTIYTGLRQGEVWGLRWADVHLDADRPRIVVRYSYRGPTKGGRTREVPLLPRAIEELRRWKAVSPGIGAAFVWPTRDRGCHAKGYDAQWERVRRLAGLGHHVFHALRHTCASHLVMGSWLRDEDGHPAPMPLTHVRDWMGHRSITTTERYAHLAPGAIHDVVRRGRREREG